MRSMLLLPGILIVGAGALFSQRPAPTAGISVQMPIAPKAVAVPAADDPNTVIIAITADGKVFSGIQPTDPARLTNLKQTTIYVKADARAPFQPVLAVLDALHGKTVILLSASPANAAKQGYLPPFGTRLTVPR